MALCDTRPAQYERNSDIFLETTGFPRRKSVLGDMETIIRGVDNEGIIDLSGSFKTCNELVNQLVDTLKGTKALAIIMVIVIYDGLILVWKIMNPTHATRL